MSTLKYNDNNAITHTEVRRPGPMPPGIIMSIGTVITVADGSTLQAGDMLAREDGTGVSIASVVGNDVTLRDFGTQGNLARPGYGTPTLQVGDVLSKLVS